MRARLIHVSKTHRAAAAKRQWIRPVRDSRPPERREAEAEVEFIFDGQALHVDGCRPLIA